MRIKQAGVMSLVLVAKGIAWIFTSLVRLHVVGWKYFCLAMYLLASKKHGYSKYTAWRLAEKESEGTQGYWEAGMVVLMFVLPFAVVINSTISWLMMAFPSVYVAICLTLILAINLAQLQKRIARLR